MARGGFFFVSCLRCTVVSCRVSDQRRVYWARNLLKAPKGQKGARMLKVCMCERNQYLKDAFGAAGQRESNNFGTFIFGFRPFIYSIYSIPYISYGQWPEHTVLTYNLYEYYIYLFYLRKVHNSRGRCILKCFNVYALPSRFISRGAQ